MALPNPLSLCDLLGIPLATRPTSGSGSQVAQLAQGRSEVGRDALEFWLNVLVNSVPCDPLLMALATSSQTRSPLSLSI